MSDNKQSSVEWLWNEVGNILPFSVDSATAIKLYNALQQAKAMHKEETCDFALKHLKDTRDIFVTDSYDETFGGNK